MLMYCIANTAQQILNIYIKNAKPQQNFKKPHKLD